MQVNGSLVNQGLFIGGGTAAVLSANGIVDLSGGTWQNLGSISVSMSSNGLLIVPVGFNPSTSFANYSTLGLTHTLGTTLTVPAGQGFGGSDSFSDPVNCQGAITAPSGGTINLSGGLTLSGTGTVSLGFGNLTTNDLTSGISGGLLSVGNHYVGSGGTGLFTQSGGTNTISNSLYLGNNAGDSGTYNLSGSGSVAMTNFNSAEYVGYSGTGAFTQSGGVNSISYSSVYLGCNPGSSAQQPQRQRPIVRGRRIRWRSPAAEVSRKPAGPTASRTGAPSASATARAAVAPTISVATVNCRYYFITARGYSWATPARGPSRSPAESSVAFRLLSSAPTLAAAAPTTSAAAANSR